MKKSFFELLKESAFWIAIFSSAIIVFFCAIKGSGKNAADFEVERANFGEELSIQPTDGVKFEKKCIIIEPNQENQTYVLSGYFYGQIISKTKNTVLKLNNLYLENELGKPALKATAKTEVSAAEGSRNFIYVWGRGFAKNAAMQARKGLVLGGSGTLFVRGDLYHGIEAEDFKVKGSGDFYVQGTKHGSAVRCRNFTVEKDKTFRLRLLNSKNAVKADSKIQIASGEFYLSGNISDFKASGSEGIYIEKNVKIEKN